METNRNEQSNGKIYLSVSHEIKDYASFKPGFDEHRPVRLEAGLKDIFMKKDASKENAITAFFEVQNLAKTKAFMSSPELKEAMTKSGVSSEPVIVYYNCASEYEAVNTSAMLTTVSHQVKDYAAWKSVYDSSAEMRKKGGTNDFLVLRSGSNENVVTVLGTASSEEKFNAFISNPELKGAMEAAGVISKPEVRVLN